MSTETNIDGRKNVLVLLSGVGYISGIRFPLATATGHCTESSPLGDEKLIVKEV
jgi:hypothetical protein